MAHVLQTYIGPGCGLSTIAVARLAGAGRVMAIGAPADRLALPRKMGADVELRGCWGSEAFAAQEVMRVPKAPVRSH